MIRQNVWFNDGIFKMPKMFALFACAMLVSFAARAADDDMSLIDLFGEEPKKEEKVSKNKKAPDLVELSGIAPLLVIAAGAHGRTLETKKSVDACTKALSKVQEKLSSEEKAMLEKFITTPGFKVFADAWQKWHDQASKEAFGV